MQFYWKDRHEGTIFLLFIYISWNSWLGRTLNNHLRYWSGFIITFQTELDYTWTWITLSGYEKYLTGLLNNINFWFFKPHNIRSSEVELDESGNILDVLLTCVTMTYNTHSCIKKCSNVNGYIIMCKLLKDGVVKAAWINATLKGRKQLTQQSLHTFVTVSLLGWLINSSPMFNKISPSAVR